MENLENGITIVWFTRAQVLDLLKVSEIQLRKDQAVLNALEPHGWNYQPRDRGFDAESFQVLKEFRRLCCFGRRVAITNINVVMEALQP